MNAAFVRLRQPYRPVAGSDRLRPAYIGKAQNSIHFELGEAFPKPTNPTIRHVPAKTKDKGGQVSPLSPWETFNRVFGKRSASGRRRAGVWVTHEPEGLSPPLWWGQVSYPCGGTGMAVVLLF